MGRYTSAGALLLMPYHRPIPTADDMGGVRYEGAYPTREKAEEAVPLVLAQSGRQLTGDERVDLAAHLPLGGRTHPHRPDPATQPRTGWSFVEDLTARTGASLATTRWGTGSVFSAVASHAGPGLLTRILHQLRTGWGLLFGRAELTTAAQRDRIGSPVGVRRPAGSGGVATRRARRPRTGPCRGAAPQRFGFADALAQRYGRASSRPMPVMAMPK